MFAEYLPQGDAFGTRLSELICVTLREKRKVGLFMIYKLNPLK